MKIKCICAFKVTHSLPGIPARIKKRMVYYVAPMTDLTKRRVKSFSTEEPLAFTRLLTLVPQSTFEKSCS